MMEGFEPLGWIVAMLRANAVEEIDGLSAAREDREVVAQSVQSQLRDDGIEPLLDEELPALRSKVLADQGEFPLGQSRSAACGFGRKIFVAHCSRMV